MEHYSSDQRDLEVLSLGILIGSQKLAAATLPTLDVDRLRESDLAAVLVELKAGGIGERTKRWMRNRGVALSGGSVVDDVLGTLKETLRRRACEAALAQATFACRLGGMDSDEVEKLIETLRKPT